MNPFRAHWQLDPAIRFLNHGSFGATPLALLARQREYQDQMEREPVRFFVRELPPLLDAARTHLAGFLNADPNCVAFMRNATEGVNSVLRSLRLERGDEVLVSDHEYNACRNVLDYVAEIHGARVVVVRLPFPVTAPEDITNALLAGVTARTKLLLIDHVTSPTGMVLPIPEIVRAMRERGVETLVDGAHAPGMVPLALDELGAAYYTGNCHKWLCTPKGAALLYVRKDLLKSVRPAIISHGANAPVRDSSRFRLEFDWTGTSDPTAILCVPHAIDFLERIVPGGITEVRRRNRDLVLRARTRLAATLGVAPPCPESMIGSLAALELPDRKDAATIGAFDTDPLQDALLLEDRIEVPIVPWPSPGKRLVRVSAQLYNEFDEYEALASALKSRLGLD